MCIKCIQFENHKGINNDSEHYILVMINEFEVANILDYKPSWGLNLYVATVSHLLYLCVKKYSLIILS